MVYGNVDTKTYGGWKIVLTHQKVENYQMTSWSSALEATLLAYQYRRSHVARYDSSCVAKSCHYDKRDTKIVTLDRKKKCGVILIRK